MSSHRNHKEARRRRVVGPWLFTAAILVASLAVRVVHRGDVIPGWDVISVAQGSWMVATKSLEELFWWQVDSLHPPGYWNFYVLPSVLVPGALARWWPWLYWGHLASFAVTLASLAVLASAFRLGWRGGWLVLLVWATSSALVSQSVTGLANGSAILPHALALWVVLRLRDRPLVTIVASVGVWFAGWQVQELGRTTSLTFLAAALLVRAPRSTRLVWLGVGGALLFDAMWFPSANTDSFTSVGFPTPQLLWDTAVGIARRLFAPPWIDLPSVLVLGVIAALLVRTDGWLWRAVLGAQIGLVFVLALQREVLSVWPRRFTLVDFYAVATTVALGAEWMRTGRRRSFLALGLAIALAASWQLVDTIRFAQAAPAGGMNTSFTLPFVHTTVDYQAWRSDSQWTRRMVEDVEAGKRLIIVYNLASYGENPTNPAAIFERLYVMLGPERYDATVHFFGQDWRWNDTRARPPSEIEPFVESITRPDEWVGWYSVHVNDAWQNEPTDRRRAEVDALLAALERRFVLRWDAAPPDDSGFTTQRFTLRERRSFAQAPTCQEPPPPRQMTPASRSRPISAASMPSSSP